MVRKIQHRLGCCFTHLACLQHDKVKPQRKRKVTAHRRCYRGAHGLDRVLRKVQELVDEIVRYPSIRQIEYLRMGA